MRLFSLSPVASYLTRQIEEIRHDRALRFYGVFVAGLQVVSAIFWQGRRAHEFLARGTEAICWPFFDTCESWRLLDARGGRIFLAAFLVWALVTGGLFCFRRTIRTAYFSLLALNFVKVLILALDFRLWTNHHLMALWITATFLFIPSKKRTLQLLIPLFYICAGLLKINSEWLSGAPLEGFLPVLHGPVLRVACTYVVLLETVVVWGLWREKSAVGWLAWGQLVLFHFFSYFVVGYFFPVVMLSLLMIYPLSWLTQGERLPIRRSTYALLALFALIEFHAKLLPGDHAITGEGRMFALRMFDATTECEARATLHGTNGESLDLNLHLPLPLRIQCDPIVYLSRARRLCRDGGAKQLAFRDLDLYVRTRRATQSVYHEVVNVPHFCSKPIRYSVLMPNAWIQK